MCSAFDRMYGKRVWNAVVNVGLRRDAVVAVV